jgi:predicted GNAT family acetyltransferase
VAPEYEVAAIGNIFTAPGYRGQGYAQQATSAVCGELLAQNCLPVLNVDQTNVNAVHIYQKLGFRRHCTYYEGLLTRLDGR